MSAVRNASTIEGDSLDAVGMRRLAYAVIQRAVDDLKLHPLGPLADHRASALTFLKTGAPGWAEIAGIRPEVIAEKFKEVQ